MSIPPVHPSVLSLQKPEDLANTVWMLYTVLLTRIGKTLSTRGELGEVP